MSERAAGIFQKKKRYSIPISTPSKLTSLSELKIEVNFIHFLEFTFDEFLSLISIDFGVQSMLHIYSYLWNTVVSITCRF